MNERERVTLSVVDTSRFTNREGVLTGLPLNIYTRIEVIGQPATLLARLKNRNPPWNPETVFRAG